MNLQALYNLKEALEDAAISGTDTSAENRQLESAIDALASVADDPVTTRIRFAARSLLAADERARPGRLLDVLGMVDAAEREFAASDVSGEWTPLTPGDGRYVHVPHSQLRPLTDALTGSGSGRVTIIEDAWANHPEYFSDLRVMPYLVASLGDAYDDLEELLGSILLKLGSRVVPFLKEGFDPAGKREMERRVYWTARLAGAAENDWFRLILPTARREVRETSIAALGVSQDNAALLLELYHNESDKKCRDAALRGLARMEDEGSRAFWTGELERRPDCPPCLEGVDSVLAADMAARALRDAVGETLARGKEELSQAELLTLAHALYAAYGKYSDTMRETWFWCAEQLPALDRIRPGGDASQWDLTAAEMLEKCLLETVLWNPCEGVRAMAQELGERFPARFLSAAVLIELLMHPAEAFDRYGRFIVKNSLLHRENAAERANRIQIMHALAAVRFRKEDGRHIPFARKDMLTGAPVAMLYRLPDFDPRWAEMLGSAKVNNDGAVYDLKSPWSMGKQMFLMEWIE